MLTQQLAASRSEDDGRISDMSFHDETLNNEDLSKIIFHNVQFSKCPVSYTHLTLPTIA